jgi:arsenate reductase
MAEGWAKKLFPRDVHVFSAGSQPANAVRPRAVEAMKEVGIDISAQKPKLISDVPLSEVDMVVTLCSDEVCVSLPGAPTQQKWALPDPAAESGSEAKIEATFRSVRDDLRRRIERMVQSWM